MEAKRKLFFFGAFIGLVLVFSFLFSLPDGKLHVVFCNVGQGDAIYLRFPDGTDGLIDGGPNERVLECLGKHLAFWDRKIEIVILTHPQADHLNGLIEVLKRYEVNLFSAPLAGNKTEGYKKLLEQIKLKNINFQNFYRGDKIRFQKVAGETLEVSFIWPERMWAEENAGSEKTTAFLQNSKHVLGAAIIHGDLNDFSQTLVLAFGDFDLLLSGDLEKDYLLKALNEEKGKINLPIEVLKVSHHGAKNALNSEILDLIKPSLAVISVGKNSYGHPNPLTLDFLKENRVQVLRTDEKGDIEIVTNGKSWEIKNK